MLSIATDVASVREYVFYVFFGFQKTCVLTFFLNDVKKSSAKV